MKKKEYQFEALITPAEEGGYFATVPALPGCVTEGDTLEETKKNLIEAIELYLETLEELGLPMPESKSTKTIRTQVSVLFGDSKKLKHA